MKVPLILLCTVTFQTLRYIQAHHPDNKAVCDLEASELGPDWYKVPQPIPTEFIGMPDYVRSFVHMPCAATTVFDEAICGCTNLMAFLFSTVDGSHKSMTSSHVNATAPPGDYVKTTEPPKPTPAGSILLNLETGEVRQCPYRASQKGPQWYMIHEPTERWRAMKCAPGTLFHKKHCTCIHEGSLDSDESKAVEATILVLEDEQTEKKGQDNTISKALGIHASDVDFRSQSKSAIPQWRRNKSNDDSNQATNKEKTPPKPSNKSTTNLQVSLLKANTQLDNLSIPLGKDAISEQHKQRLLRKGPVPMIQQEATALAIDSSLDNSVKKVKVITIDTKADLLALDKMIENMKKEKTTHDSKDFVGRDSRDEVIVFSHKECSKKPIPELGPQFFQLYIWGFGLVPYICNGNRMYDHNKCACVVAPRNASFDEVHFPVTDCHKRAAPELGPQYFQMYQWGVGFTPYRCHLDSVFNLKLCACVKP